MKALGIDLGTTKIAVVIFDSQNGLQSAVSAAHHAAISNSDPAVFEQDTAKLIDCTENLISQLPPSELAEISAVGVTGQMHSLLLIKDGTPGNLITWQDQRCGSSMISGFNRVSGLSLRDGFGGTSLARMAAAKELSPDCRCAAISDYLTARLTGQPQIITDPTHAASWGIYDARRGTWNLAAIRKLNIPAEILPEIRPCGAILGKPAPGFCRRTGLPENAVVINAIGDNQASIIGSGDDPATEIYLTLGTGAQLSAATAGFSGELPENLELRPFPGNRQLLVSAPLCGGAAFAFLADTVNKFRTALGETPLDRGKLLDKLDGLAMEYLQKNGDPAIRIAPHFLGERHAPELRGTISNLTLDNADPGAIAAALAKGIVCNLKNGFPAAELASRRRIIGSGNAVRLLKCIQYLIEQEFRLPLVVSDAREEAACGAAIQALSAVSAKTASGQL